MKTRHGLALAVVLALGACTSGQEALNAPAPSAGATESEQPDAPTGATSTPFASSTEPVAVEPGTYRIPRSAWSIVDFAVTIPEDWTVQAGHVYAKHPDTADEFGFYAVVVDEIYADACEGNDGEIIRVGPGVDQLAAALLGQPGPKASGPVGTTLGGYPATRIDLTIPEGFDLDACSLGDIGLQIWHSAPADKYFLLLPDAIASVYIIEVGGQRQVFLTQYRTPQSDENVRELQAVHDSIHIVHGWPDTTRNRPGVYSWDGNSSKVYGWGGAPLWTNCGTGSFRPDCGFGGMHNGWPPPTDGSIDIRLDVAAEGAIRDEGATAVTVAGHDGIHRRIDARREEWIVDIEGTTIAIRLVVRPGTSPADLAEAYAIIGSMWTRPEDNDLGFRLLFTLTSDDWTSG